MTSAEIAEYLDTHGLSADLTPRGTIAVIPRSGDLTQTQIAFLRENKTAIIAYLKIRPPEHKTENARLKAWFIKKSKVIPQIENILSWRERIEWRELCRETSLSEAQGLEVIEEMESKGAVTVEYEAARKTIIVCTPTRKPDNTGAACWLLPGYAWEYRLTGEVRMRWYSTGDTTRDVTATEAAHAILDQHPGATIEDLCPTQTRFPNKRHRLFSS